MSSASRAGEAGSRRRATPGLQSHSRWTRSECLAGGFPRAVICAFEIGDEDVKSQVPAKLSRLAAVGGGQHVVSHALQEFSHATQSIGGDAGVCSTTPSDLCIKDADCPSGETCVVTGGAFVLHYTISKK